MTAPDKQHAPGCFGSALTCRIETPECASCTFVAECGPRSAKRLAALREKFGIPQPISQQKETAVSKSKPTLTRNGLTLPVKVAEIVRRIEAAGVKVTESLAAGVNPFTSKPAFLRVACHLIMHMEDGVTRDLLSTAFQKKLSWKSDATRPVIERAANEYALIATQVLGAIGAIEEVNGRYKVRKCNG